MVYQLDGHEDGINCLAVSSDDSVLVSGSEDNTARVWSIEDEEQEEDMEDLDELFNEDNDKKEGIEEEGNKSIKSATSQGNTSIKSATSQGNRTIKSATSQKSEEDAESQDGNPDEDVEEVLNIDKEEDTSSNQEEGEGVLSSGIKNEGEARCLGVLR